MTDDTIKSCPIPTCQSENLTGRIVKRGDIYKKKLECIRCGYTWERDLTREEKEEFNG